MAKRAQEARPPSRGRHARATRFASPPRGLHSPNQTASAERLLYGSEADFEWYSQDDDGIDNCAEFEKYGDSDVVKLYWHEPAVALNRVHDLPDLDRGFYAFVEKIREGRGEFDHKILYIGLAYEQSVVRRVRQQHKAYETFSMSSYHVKRAKKGIDSEILVMAAEIVAAIKERKTKELYEDIENLLISRHRPRLNKKHKTYAGRLRLVVINEGNYHPLRSRCSTLLGGNEP